MHHRRLALLHHFFLRSLWLPRDWTIVFRRGCHRSGKRLIHRIQLNMEMRRTKNKILESFVTVAPKPILAARSSVPLPS
jgi:hypothetical protein